METTQNSQIKPIDKKSFLEIEPYAGNSVQVEPVQLVQDVIEMFKEAEHPNPSTWATFMQPGSWNHTDDKIQRFAINTALRLILGNYTEASTIDVRFCIVDEASIKDWKRLLKTEVIPFFVKHRIFY